MRAPPIFRIVVQWTMAGSGGEGPFRSGIEQAFQQYPRLYPVSLYGAGREVQCLSRFLFRQASEKAAVDHPREPWLHCRETLQGVVQLQEHLRLIIGGYRLLIQRDLPAHTPPF